MARKETINLGDAKFSIVIPTFARPAALVRCLRALTLQTLGQPFEVIVVNDGGPGLPQIPVEFGESLQLRVLHQPNSGPAAARTLGTAAATGRYLAFTDDDCEPAAQWLEELNRSLEANPCALVGGRTVNALASNLCSAASQLLIDFLYECYVSEGSPRFFTSNNVALSREAYREMGGFDPHFPLAAAEDRDFCSRWRDAARPIVYAPNAVVQHLHRLNIGEYLRQHYQYGRGAYRFRKKRAESGEAVRIEPIGFYTKLILYPWSRARGSAASRIAITALFVLSQIANAAGFFRERL